MNLVNGVEVDARGWELTPRCMTAAELERLLARVPRATPDRELEEEQQLRANLLEAEVEATLQGHELGSWEPVDEELKGWEARCGRCGGTVYVSGKTLYAVLGERCPG